MSELDKYFGIAERTDMPELRPNTNNWRCEPQLFDILDAWKDEYPNLCVTSRDRRTSYGAAREILKIIGEQKGGEFVRQAAQHSRKHGLAVSTLYSLIYFREKWFAKNRVDDRSRYLRGLEDG
jgi:hypothetical protein